MAPDIKNEFEQARLKHLLFKSKLRAILLGAEIEEAPVLSEHDCPFGQWMQTYLLKKCKDSAALKELETIHTEMHRLTRIVVKNYHAGAEAASEVEMKKIEILGDRILELLDILERHC
ncbi:CZB domain-containing protein [Adhaeribacter sp. BT258]|uniref:CZB domain-containing protein n=1 Tax=Adhaeribacter terrigena TaxID=2793070 RepID=A0ABS1C221_9BACT|nr:CZB domain-containing protein [Adhaeribacter terrigena]MBK0403436.1 CZB domain-containing protein [Adhaeribacter terrigena]